MKYGNAGGWRGPSRKPHLQKQLALDKFTTRVLMLDELDKKLDTPVFDFSSSLVKAGCLLGVSVDQDSQGRQAADLTRHLLRPRKGVNLQSLEEVQFRIILNQNVAELLSIEFPKSLIIKSRR